MFDRLTVFGDIRLSNKQNMDTLLKNARSVVRQQFANVEKLSNFQNFRSKINFDYPSELINLEQAGFSRKTATVETLRKIKIRQKLNKAFLKGTSDVDYKNDTSNEFFAKRLPRNKEKAVVVKLDLRKREISGSEQLKNTIAIIKSKIHRDNKKEYAKMMIDNYYLDGNRELIRKIEKNSPQFGEFFKFKGLNLRSKSHGMLL